jgi:hypothetical protein
MLVRNTFRHRDAGRIPQTRHPPAVPYSSHTTRESSNVSVPLGNSPNNASSPDNASSIRVVRAVLGKLGNVTTYKFIVTVLVTKLNLCHSFWTSKHFKLLTLPWVSHGISYL